jgi:hypothetical protein
MRALFRLPTGSVSSQSKSGSLPGSLSVVGVVITSSGGVATMLMTHGCLLSGGLTALVSDILLSGALTASVLQAPVPA